MLEKVDLKASADSVRLLLEPLMRQRGIQLEIESSGDTTVTAYSVETRQVMLNLVRNACEATTRSGAKVVVSITGHPQEVEIVVTDRGSGIEPAMIPNLFQFGASTKGDRGNGMGLWVVKQLVEKHGGDIDLETKVGEGTRFTIRWPREYPILPISPEPLKTASALH
jgi:signal transduction histidine kinase